MDVWKRNLAVLWLAQFLVMAAMNQIMPFLPFLLTRELGLSDARDVHVWTGLIFGVNFLPALLVAPLWGNLADRYGRKLMILRSGFGMAIANGLMGFVQTPEQLLLLRFLNGMISGFIPASIALVSTNTPRERVGTALGVLQSGGVAGTILGPALGGLLADRIGFRALFWVTGGALLFATLIVLFFVRETNRPSPAARPAGGGFRRDAARILATRPLPALFASSLFVQFALVALMPVLALYTETLLGKEEGAAFWAGVVMGMTGVANMLASPVLGRFSDRFGGERVLVGSLVAGSAFMFLHALVESVGGLMVARFLFGLAAGGLMPSINALIREKAPAGMESRTYGLANSATFFGNMVGPIVGGAVSGLFGMRAVFVFSGAVLLADAALAWREIVPAYRRKAASPPADRGEAPAAVKPPAGFGATAPRRPSGR
ncbi:MAG: MFS transporter [Hydrogenibacillus schlegelii]|uniref:MFS transporter n=1 Tax=Hydrogenibacillus schlegelii TaxID=1484 RepID=A0A947CUW0_HYDSH|nr:MFS transporter [Hydrogenibacillus schlegelii]